MKLFVALAMLSVAFAADVKPITLPRAPLPAVETANIPHPEPIDISPLFVPLEVMEAVRIAERAHAVRVVESIDVEPVVLPNAKIPEVSDAVRVVESVVLPSPEVPAVETEEIEVIPNPQPRGIVIPQAALEYILSQEEPIKETRSEPVDAVRVVESAVLNNPELPAVETEEIEVIPNPRPRGIVIPQAALEYILSQEEPIKETRSEPVDAVRVVESAVINSPELPAVETEEIEVIPNPRPRGIVIPQAVLEYILSQEEQVKETRSEPVDAVRVVEVAVNKYNGKVHDSPWLR